MSLRTHKSPDPISSSDAPLSVAELQSLSDALHQDAKTRRQNAARPNSGLDGALVVADATALPIVNMARAVDAPETETDQRRVAVRHRLIRHISQSLAMLDGLCGDRKSSGFGVLMYHRCSPDPGNGLTPDLNVSPEQLECQLAGLKQRGFLFRALPDVLQDLRDKRPIDRRTVVVTFDDGFAGVRHFALPVLERLQVPASVFVCTGFLDRHCAMPFDHWGRAHATDVPEEFVRSLTTAECDELIDSGLIDLGAHTHTHEDFRGRPEDLFVDLQRCVDVLSRRFNISHPTFAFPFGTPALGYVTEQLIRSVQRAGLSCALTTEARINMPGDDVFALGRLNAFEWDTPATLQARLHGWYSWIPQLSAKLRRIRYGSTAGTTSDSNGPLPTPIPLSDREAN